MEKGILQDPRTSMPVNGGFLAPDPTGKVSWDTEEEGNELDYANDDFRMFMNFVDGGSVS